MVPYRRTSLAIQERVMYAWSNAGWLGTSKAGLYLEKSVACCLSGLSPVWCNEAPSFLVRHEKKHAVWECVMCGLIPHRQSRWLVQLHTLSAVLINVRSVMLNLLVNAFYWTSLFLCALLRLLMSGVTVEFHKFCVVYCRNHEGHDLESSLGKSCEGGPREWPLSVDVVSYASASTSPRGRSECIDSHWIIRFVARK